MNRAYKAEGIILSRRNIGEADKLIVLLTKQYGKKVAIAKGIRRITSRRAPYLEPFFHVTLMLHTGRTFDIITEVSTIESFSFVRKKLERVGFIYIALELIERMTAENQESVAIFSRLTTFLRTLNDPEAARSDAEQELLSFKHFLLSELGFIRKELAFTHQQIDGTINSILESQLKSPLLLTNIQQSL